MFRGYNNVKIEDEDLKYFRLWNYFHINDIKKVHLDKPPIGLLNILRLFFTFIVIIEACYQIYEALNIGYFIIFVVNLLAYFLYATTNILIPKDEDYINEKLPVDGNGNNGDKIQYCLKDGVSYGSIARSIVLAIVAGIVLDILCYPLINCLWYQQSFSFLNPSTILFLFKLLFWSLYIGILGIFRCRRHYYWLGKFGLIQTNKKIKMSKFTGSKCSCCCYRCCSCICCCHKLEEFNDEWAITCMLMFKMFSQVFYVNVISKGASSA